MQLRPLKTWLYDASVRYGVHPRSVYRWKRRGCFDPVNFIKRNPRVVDVVGEPRLLRRPVDGRQFQYDFTGVDWSARNSVIATRLGCSPSLVSRRRRNNP
jgi:hypothetical protein